MELKKKEKKNQTKKDKCSSNLTVFQNSFLRMENCYESHIPWSAPSTQPSVAWPLSVDKLLSMLCKIYLIELGKIRFLLFS